MSPQWPYLQWLMFATSCLGGLVYQSMPRTSSKCVRRTFAYEQEHLCLLISNMHTQKLYRMIHFTCSPSIYSSMFRLICIQTRPQNAIYGQPHVSESLISHIVEVVGVDKSSRPKSNHGAGMWESFPAFTSSTDCIITIIVNFCISHWLLKHFHNLYTSLSYNIVIICYYEWIQWLHVMWCDILKCINIS